MKIPSALKVLAALLPLSILIGSFIYLSLRAQREEKNFYKKEIASLIVRYSDWQKRSVDFYLADGTRLNFFNPAEDRIAVGDSIYKSRNTFQYMVFRKKAHGKYQLVAIYDYRKKY